MIDKQAFRPMEMRVKKTGDRIEGRYMGMIEDLGRPMVVMEMPDGEVTLNPFDSCTFKFLDVEKEPRFAFKVG